MSVRILLELVIVLSFLTGCEKEKKDDFIVKRRERVVVRHEPGNQNGTVNEDGGLLMDNIPGVAGNPASTLPPTLSITISENILSVSFLDSGVYDLFIENKSATLVYSSKLPADGQVYEFDLSDISRGDLYVLTLVGESAHFMWYF